MRFTVEFACRLALAGLLGAATTARAEAPERDLLGTRVHELVEAGEPRALGEPLVAVPLLAAFYSRRDFEPAWREAAKVDELRALLAVSLEHGLDPEDYHAAAIERAVARARAGLPSMDAHVDLDILLTEALIRLVYHLRFGKVDPEDLDPNWNLSRALGMTSPVEALEQVVTAPSLADAVESFAPPVPYYGWYRETLARLRGVARAGGWPVVPGGETLRPGVVDPRVAALRRRLEVAGEDAAGFDAAVEQAVRRFQRQHGLAEDGLVGPGTLSALNVPVEARIDQVRVNLERVRWVFRDLESTFLLVNIAGFEVMLVRDRDVVFRSRAQVGTPYRQTPVFKGSMTYLEFNPTWTVPPTILAKDVLPAIRRDPTYLDRKNMRVIDSSGSAVDPSSIDWEAVTPRGFPYMVRQEPGPDNALGRVKFIFPNSHFVFLHDTPARAQFERTERAFSSGCIRVDRPFELAELLLDDPRSWDADAIRGVVDAGRTRRIHLTRPMPVYLLYWTVDFDLETGEPRFIPDVYGRDARVLAALEGDFTFKPPAVGR